MASSSSAAAAAAASSSDHTLLTPSFFLNALPPRCSGLFAPAPLHGLTARGLHDPSLNGPVVLRAHIPARGRFVVEAAGQRLCSIQPASLQSAPELFLGGLATTSLNGVRVVLQPAEAETPGRFLVRQVQPPGGVISVHGETLFLSAAAAAATCSPFLSMENLLPAPGEEGKLEFWVLSSMVYGSSLFEGALGEHLRTCAARGVMLGEWAGSNVKSIRSMLKKERGSSPFLLRPQCDGFYLRKVCAAVLPRQAAPVHHVRKPHGGGPAAQGQHPVCAGLCEEAARGGKPGASRGQPAVWRRRRRRWWWRRWRRRGQRV